jgi:hypothetical protein
MWIPCISSTFSKPVAASSLTSSAVVAVATSKSSSLKSTVKALIIKYSNALFGNDQVRRLNAMETMKMNRKILLLIAALLVIVVSLTLMVYFCMRFQDVANQSWLKLGTYMVYEQFFVWNGNTETDYMIWNVTELEGDFADVSLTSHGVNVTARSVELTLGEANFTIDVITGEVVNCSDPHYVEEKWPFWIERNVTIGSIIDIWYGINVISRNETIYVLGKQRDCWVVEYSWVSASMKRWFDKSSGICLKIHVVLHEQNAIIQITETAVLTNVDLDFSRVVHR